MNNITTSQGLNPLGIRISGSGEYVKNQLEHLQDYMDMVEFTQREEIRQSYE